VVEVETSPMAGSTCARVVQLSEWTIGVVTPNHQHIRSLFGEFTIETSIGLRRASFPLAASNESVEPPHMVQAHPYWHGRADYVSYGPAADTIEAEYNNRGRSELGDSGVVVWIVDTLLGPETPIDMVPPSEVLFDCVGRSCRRGNGNRLGNPPN